MTAQLRYVDDQARTIFGHWDKQDPPRNPEEFWETFQDNIEACAFGAPLSIFPELSVADTELLAKLIASRLYQFIRCPELIGGEI